MFLTKTFSIGSQLNTVDIGVIIAFLLASLGIAFLVKQRANSSKDSFFVGNRNLPWYVVGISMVATTFAADTPLAVAEIVGKNGISGNWLWWYAMMGGMLTAVFFSHLWRRSRVVTENEFISLRYFGKPAKFLRVAKAAYLGIFINVIIMAWVNLAMLTIFKSFFNVDYGTAFALTTALMILVAIYSSISGFLGVVYTDVLQFILAMAASIVLCYMVLDLPAIGGIKGLASKLKPEQMNFFPANDDSNKWLNFLTLISVVWWASWYPGQEPGGGGYIAQRMAAAKDEKNATFATLLFQIAHICLRPWPWIIVGLCCVILYPDLSGDELKNGYVYAMRDHLPQGIKGLMLVGFIGAYMSTISTHLNWGASYIVNDIIKINNPNIKQEKELLLGRVSTVGLMILAAIVSTQITSISGTWLFIMECGAGLGLVLILRWYWWRINAWTEISATIAPVFFYGVLQIIDAIKSTPEEPWIYSKSPYSILIVVGLTTITWLIVLYKTSGKESVENRKQLLDFYNQVRPQGRWQTVAQKSSITLDNSTLIFKLLFWICSIVFAYNLLFLIGNLLFQNYQSIIINGVLIVISAILGLIMVTKKHIFNQ